MLNTKAFINWNNIEGSEYELVTVKEVQVLAKVQHLNDPYLSRISMVIMTKKGLVFPVSVIPNSDKWIRMFESHLDNLASLPNILVNNLLMYRSSIRYVYLQFINLESAGAINISQVDTLEEYCKAVTEYDILSRHIPQWLSTEQKSKLAERLDTWLEANNDIFELKAKKYGNDWFIHLLEQTGDEEAKQARQLIQDYALDCLKQGITPYIYTEDTEDNPTLQDLNKSLVEIVGPLPQDIDIEVDFNDIPIAI
jgi:hypothetical protein